MCCICNFPAVIRAQNGASIHENPNLHSSSPSLSPFSSPSFLPSPSFDPAIIICNNIQQFPPWNDFIFCFSGSTIVRPTLSFHNSLSWRNQTRYRGKTRKSDHFIRLQRTSECILALFSFSFFLFSFSSFLLSSSLLDESRTGVGERPPLPEGVVRSAIWIVSQLMYLKYLITTLTEKRSFFNKTLCDMTRNRWSG